MLAEVVGDLISGSLALLADAGHVWSITEERPMITLEVEVEATADPVSARREVKARLESQCGIAHATVEIHVKN